jgi:hypothetical protein
MENNSIFFQCKVLNTQDPMMLGRIRGIRVIDNEKDVLKSVSDPPWNEQKDIWTDRDPLVFNPLLPYFFYQVPKVNELIQVLYINNDFKYQNQYYIQNTYSTPTATFDEYFIGGNKFTGTGTQNENPKALKNKNGSLVEPTIHEGVFPEPGDNAILGRGSSDLIIKQDEVLLRAGKFKGETLQPNILPEANAKRSFLQLSKFQNEKILLPPKTYFELREDVLLTKYLIEWVIINPENTQNKFTGSVYLYQLKPDASINTKNIGVNTLISDNLKKLVISENFSQLSSNKVIEFINKFIKDANDNTFTNGRLFFPNIVSPRFPIFYRPNQLMSSKINPSTPIGASASDVEVKNILNIYENIKLNPSIVGGYGLIYAKDKVGVPRTPFKQVVPQTEYFNREVTSASLGGDTLFLLSHNSQIPGKGKINFENTLYGISSEKFTNEIIPKTSSTVRGEELLELIDMIVRFLITHTHAYPGLPPVEITQDGSSTQSILSEIQNASNKILNGNIRLN